MSSNDYEDEDFTAYEDGELEVNPRVQLFANIKDAERFLDELQAQDYNPLDSVDAPLPDLAPATRSLK